MRGKHRIHVYNARLSYRMEIGRNITILRGDSATGKTTLIDMIQAFEMNGADSGISVESDKNLAVINGINWQGNIKDTHDSIVFIDEGSDFVASTDFADAIKASDNYYVIATRTSLFNLPYSIKEVYGIRNVSGNRYQETKRLYSEFYPLYDEDIAKISKPECAVVEDAKSGYDFFKNLFSKYYIPCISAGGKSNVYETIASSEYNTILLIADGAAFGPEIERILSLRKAKNLIVYLPESFEWLILKSDLLRSKKVGEVLEEPSDYVESSEYFSWERFFADFLIQSTKDTKYEYKKARLNPIYLNKRESSMILKVMPEFDF